MSSQIFLCCIHNANQPQVQTTAIHRLPQLGQILRWRNFIILSSSNHSPFCVTTTGLDNSLFISLNAASTVDDELDVIRATSVTTFAHHRTSMRRAQHQHHAECGMSRMVTPGFRLRHRRAAL
jgi:hypothetical protein